MKMFDIDLHASVRLVDTIEAPSEQAARAAVLTRLEAFRKLANAHGFTLPTFRIALDEAPQANLAALRANQLGLLSMWNKEVVVTHLDPDGHLSAPQKDNIIVQGSYRGPASEAPRECTCPVQSPLNRALRGPQYDPACPVHPPPPVAAAHVDDHGCCDDPDCPSNN
jgi:hypothetical protein